MSDQMLTLVDVEDSTHIAKTLEATFCGLGLDRKLRQTLQDRSAGQLDAEGTLICYACQVRWAAYNQEHIQAAVNYLFHGDDLCLDTAAQEDVLRGLGDEDPGAVLAATLDRLEDKS